MTFAPGTSRALGPEALHDVGRPLPIAERTRGYFNTLGWSC
jgi:hypothetical protein